jgi:hypothetical protein
MKLGKFGCPINLGNFFIFRKSEGFSFETVCPNFFQDLSNVLVAGYENFQHVAIAIEFVYLDMKERYVCTKHMHTQSKRSAQAHAYMHKSKLLCFMPQEGITITIPPYQPEGSFLNVISCLREK